MPLGTAALGYLQGGFNWLGNQSTRGALGLASASASASGTITGGLLGAGALGLSRLGRASAWAGGSPLRALGVTGGIAGIGLRNEDTGVLGGALGGTALGLGTFGAMRLGSLGAAAYSAARMGPGGMGRGFAAWNAMSIMGRASARFIGSSYTQAINRIRGMSF